MKKIFITFLGLLCAQAFAQLPTMELENFRANYESPQGKASASKFKYEDLDFGNNPQFELYQQAGQFVLNGGGREFVIESLPESVYDWKSLVAKGVDLSLSPKAFTLKSGRIEYVSNEDKAGFISGIDVKCQTTSKNELLGSFLDMCLNQKMDFYVPSVGGVNFNNINIWSHNNSLRFSLKNQVWLKGQGKIYHEKNAKLVRIRVDRVKAGFLNVTGKFFSEVEKIKKDFIRVDRPWIEIQLP